MKPLKLLQIDNMIEKESALSATFQGLACSHRQINNQCEKIKEHSKKGRTDLFHKFQEIKGKFKLARMQKP